MQIRTTHVWEADVEHDAACGLTVRGRKEAAGVGVVLGVIAERLQQFAARRAGAMIAIDDVYVGALGEHIHAASGVHGSISVKVMPPCALRSQRTRPRCRSATERAIGSPKPVPSFLVV